jgi:tripartite-type tricarboxylate transporter receptor subunit TctC
MIMTVSRPLALLFAACALQSVSVFVHAQNYPQKPVRIIVPYTPGGATDILARLLAAKFTESMGQQFIAENRPGAAGLVGAEVAARAAPDGHTLWVGQASNLAINQHLMKKIPYDPLTAFTPISLVATSPNLLVVHPSLPVRTIKDLIALAKAKPGVINYTSSGSGSPGHLAAEYLKKLAVIDMVHIPQKGAAPALLDVLAGHASLYFTSPISAQPLVKAGRVRQIAVTSAKRFPPLPDVPAVAEAGFPAFDMASWWGLLAPAGLPKEIVARLHAETLKAVESSDTKEKLTSQSILVVTNTPEQFAVYIRSEIANWGRIVAASGARLD